MRDNEFWFDVAEIALLVFIVASIALGIVIFTEGVNW